MVHALSEARRLLKPDGILIDLRPAVEHTRVGTLCAGRFHELGIAYGSLEGQRAANRALSRFLASKLLRQAMRVRFACHVAFASPRALQEWLADFNESGGGPAEERLIQRAAEASRRQREKGRIVVRLALVMRVLVL